jgi:hypothetical protein
MARMSAALQLASWVGRKSRGSARLHWGDHELILYVSATHVIAVEGDDGEVLSSAFGLVSGGEWFREAQNAVAGGQVSQGEANAVVKRALAESLHAFFAAPDATVSFDPTLLYDTESLTISYPHLVTELVLGSGGEDLVPVFLANPDWLLRRLPDFLRRVDALGLTEEALAILAKVNDARSAEEIAAPSPHGRDVALRLLAAAVAGGLVEAAARLPEVPVLSAAEEAEMTRPRRRVWRWLLLFVLLAAVVAAIALTAPWKRGATAGAGGPWGVAVDGGCQPAELERLYRSQDRDPVQFRVVPFGQGQEQCYRLVWGHFPTRVSAEQAMTHLPDGVLARGFAPHVVQAEGTTP